MSKKWEKECIKEWNKWYNEKSSNTTWKAQGQIINTREAWLEGARTERNKHKISKNESSLSKTKVKLKLDIIADVRNRNGRIYPKSVIENCLNDYEKHNKFVVRYKHDIVDNCMVPYSKCVGVYDGYDILKNGEYNINILPIKNFELFKYNTISIHSIEIYENADNIVKKIYLTCFYLEDKI